MSDPKQRNEKALPEDPTNKKVEEEATTKRTAVPISSTRKRSDVAEASTTVAKSGPKIDIDKPSKADGEHFDIVLVDMVASVKSQRLVCVKKNMYDEDPEFSYACVSYRWGEVDEQIALTPDYNAHITSFGLDDLLIVCQQILNWSSDGGFEDEAVDEEEEVQDGGEDGAQDGEEDGAQDGEEDGEEDGAQDGEEDVTEKGEEDYGEDDWHDGGGEHNYSEMTIRYLWVDAISVDQMDVAHKKATIHRMTEIYSRAKVIVAIPDLHRNYLVNNPANAECLAMVSKYGRRFYRHIMMDCWYHESDYQPNNQEDEDEEEEDEDQADAKTLNESNDALPKHRGFRQFIKETIYYQGKTEDEKNICDLGVGGNNSQTSLVAKNDQLTTEASDEEQDTTEVEEGDEEGEEGDEEGDEEGEENQEGDGEEEEEERMCLCTEDMSELEADAFYRAADFLEFLVDDWSNRVWVISEYSIGRHSNMRLWFISICYDNYSLRPRELFHMFSDRSPILYNNLLDERPLLNIFMNSRATRNEDRFVAMLPLFKEFKQYVDTNALSTWNITDMVSVRLQLLRIISFKEKLAILLCCTRPSFLSDIILPSFASAYLPGILNWAIELSQSDSLIKEIDLKKDDTGLDYLRVVVPWSRTFTESTVLDDLDVSSIALSRLGLNPEEMVTVFIPITVHDERTNHTLGIKLFGDRTKNTWISLHRMVDLVDVLPTTPTSDHPVEHHHHAAPHRSASLDTLWSDKHETSQVFHIY